VDPARREDFLRVAARRNLRLAPFGTLSGGGAHRIVVR
jgi:hypothetical protein